ncbi:MAG TPA: hypothetical protein VEM57_03905 [Candidatus Binatus sp.]|nr:hypothetical protein [Candidatus Binatus sp.]
MAQTSTSRAKVIEVDFAARRRVHGVPSQRPRVARPRPLAALQGLGRSAGFLVFWRPPARRSAGEYLGGRWDWGWTLFVWTTDAAVGPVWGDLVNTRGYVAQRLTRQGFVSFLRRADDVGGLLLDGELDGDGHVIRAEPDQLIRRTDALSVLGP